MLKISNLYKSFGNTLILEDINLIVEKLSIVGLAGPSGGGKSTLLRCIQNLETIDSGNIQCEGSTGFIFQDFQLFSHMTVLQNLIYARELKNKSKYYKKQSMTMLERLGIVNKTNEYPCKLSGGQKQKVALARSLMMQPDILLCDEPTSGLDALSISDVVSLLKLVNSIGVTMIIASHDLDFLTQISTCIVCLKNGKIEEM